MTVLERSQRNGTTRREVSAQRPSGEQISCAPKARSFPLGRPNGARLPSHRRERLDQAVTAVAPGPHNTRTGRGDLRCPTARATADLAASIRSTPSATPAHRPRPSRPATATSGGGATLRCGLGHRASSPGRRIRTRRRGVGHVAGEHVVQGFVDVFDVALGSLQPRRNAVIVFACIVSSR